VLKSIYTINYVKFKNQLTDRRTNVPYVPYFLIIFSLVSSYRPFLRTYVMNNKSLAGLSFFSSVNQTFIYIKANLFAF